MFSFPLLKGNSSTAMNDPHSMIITQKLAKKIFNDEDPIGKTIRMGNSVNYTITGILKDLPTNTQFDSSNTWFPMSRKHWKEILIRIGQIFYTDVCIAKTQQFSREIKCQNKKYCSGTYKWPEKTEEFLYR